MAATYLTTIPAEIRTRILDLLFAAANYKLLRDDEYDSHGNVYHSSDVFVAEWNFSLAITQVCQLLKTEARPVLATQLTLQLTTGRCGLDWFKDAIPL